MPSKKPDQPTIQAIVTNVEMLTRLDVNVASLLKRSDEDRQTVKDVAKSLQEDFDAHKNDDNDHFRGVREEQKRMARMLNIGLGVVGALQFIILVAIAVWGNFNGP